MTNVEARIKIKGKHFEILVDVDRALQFKKGIGSIENVLAIDEIFYDAKKGLKTSSSDLKEAFGTDDIRKSAETIVKNGEVVLPSNYKKKEVETKLKQIVDFLTKNAIDPATGNPHTEKRIQEAIEQAGIKIENKPVEQQIQDVLNKLRPVIPIAIKTKRLKIVIPAVYTGKAYGLVKTYVEKEDWLSNGDLSCIINLPVGLEMEFYDKLNGITHGSALAEEMK